MHLILIMLKNAQRLRIADGVGSISSTTNLTFAYMYTVSIHIDTSGRQRKKNATNNNNYTKEKNI